MSRRRFDDPEPPPPPLPDLYGGTLDEAGLEALFADLQAIPEVIAAQVRVAGRAEGVALGRAVEMFRGGETPALQVQYRFDGGVWRDTVMRVPGGARLVRIREEDSPDQEPRGGMPRDPG